MWCLHGRSKRSPGNVKFGPWATATPARANFNPPPAYFYQLSCADNYDRKDRRGGANEIQPRHWLRSHLPWQSHHKVWVKTTGAVWVCGIQVAPECGKQWVSRPQKEIVLGGALGCSFNHVQHLLGRILIFTCHRWRSLFRDQGGTSGFRASREDFLWGRKSIEEPVLKKINVSLQPWVNPHPQQGESSQDVGHGWNVSDTGVWLLPMWLSNYLIHRQ